MDLLRELAVYRPWNEQEERDCAELLRRLHSGEELYSRDNVAAHLTVSAWVVSPDRSQVLMAYHKLYDSWAWLGGHADGDRDLLAVALREVREESGLTDVRPVSEQIYSLEKSFSGTSTVNFYQTHKQVHVSRRYYQVLKERLNEMR